MKMYSVKNAFLAIIFPTYPIFIFGAYTTSFGSNSPDSDTHSVSSFEDALVYPKHALSPYHEGERASNAMIKTSMRDTSKTRLKNGKERKNRARIELNDLKKGKAKKTSNNDSYGKSFNSSFTRKTTQRKEAKIAKAMKQMKQFTETFQISKNPSISGKPENRNEQRNSQHLYPKDSQTSAGRVKARRMAYERKLHLSISNKAHLYRKD